MITKLSLGNFKSFAETQEIPIKPLTLIFGANSAGKSSLIHGIALAHHVIATGDLDVYSTSIGGEAIDLGGFRQYVHRRNKDLNVEWAVELDVSRLSGRTAELMASVKTITITIIFGIFSPEGTIQSELEHEKPDEELLEKINRKLNELDKRDLKAIKDMLIREVPSIRTCEITGDGQMLFRLSRRNDGRYRFDRLEPEHPVLREIFKAIVEVYTTSTTLSESDYEGFRESVTDLLRELTVKIDKFLPRCLLKNGNPLDAKPSFLAAIRKGTRKDNLAEATKNFLPIILNELIQGLSEMTEAEINRFQYLGPLRSYPSRHIAFSQHEDINWFAGGGYAWDVIRREFKIRKKVNAWLGNKDKLSTPYELVVRNLLTIDDLDKDYTKIIEDLEERFTTPYDETVSSDDLFGEIYEAMNRLKDYESNISDVQELNLIDLRSNTIVSHRDVGIGISQVLPVLVGAYASKNKIIAIEQPEIHLHPALQAEMGDVFIESALGKNKNTFILETHSEHLILRILRRIRETSRGKNDKTAQIRPENVTLLYVGASQQGSSVQELRINEDGRLLDHCPGGFFEEGFEELF
ncbi:MAG: AAA family ATPase [Nitrospirae bacterium]|nr:AAA family ATPase [Nitrospirota bacterium]